MTAVLPRKEHGSDMAGQPSFASLARFSLGPAPGSSPIAFYLRHDPSLRMYTYDWDIQIGQVWGCDINASGLPPQDSAVVAFYGSNFLGSLEDPSAAMSLMLYDDGEEQHRQGANAWTTYARTGLTDFRVVAVGEFNSTSQVFNTKTTSRTHPYLVAIASNDHDGIATLQWTDGTLWSVEQGRLDTARGLPNPPSWPSLFSTTTLPPQGGR